MAVRAAFAKQILAASGIDDSLLERAFSSIKREHYIGPAPWLIATYNRYQEVLSQDPVVLYQDRLFALQSARMVNNGSPTLHAWGLHTLGLSRGDTVAHIGAGRGYYTAIISDLVGSAGSVLAVEYNEDLAHRAIENLAELSNVTVVQGSGASWPEIPTDAIYVNYATHRPAEKWLECLKIGGKLIFPLAVPDEVSQNSSAITASGIFLLVERSPHGFKARSLGSAFFVWDDAASGQQWNDLKRSLSRGDADRIRSLRVGPRKEGEWFSTHDWGLSYEPL